MFDTKKLQKVIKNKRTQQGLVLSAAAATLVASGGAPAGNPSTGLQAGEVGVVNTAGGNGQLAADLSAVDTLAEAGTYHFQWLSDGANVGADSPFYTPTTADSNKNITLAVTYTNKSGVVTTVNSGQVATQTVTNNAPTGNVTIGNSAASGVELTANTSSLADADGLGTLHYQWQVDGQNVGTDSANYTPTAAEAGKSINVTVGYTDGDGTGETLVSNQVATIIDATNNTAPVYDTATLTVTMDENQTAVATVAATDADGDTLTYTLSGADQALFNVDANGQITFKAAPDYETPADAGGDNIYNITVNASDASASASRDVIIKVKDIAEAPSLSLGQGYTPYGEELLVNSITDGAQREPTIAGLKNGGFITSWHSSDHYEGDKSLGAIKAQLHDANGAKVGGEFLVNSEFEGTQYGQQITVLSDGKIVITWVSDAENIGISSDTDIKAQIFDESGNKFGGEFRVNTIRESSQKEVAITALNDGGFIIGWNTPFGREEAVNSPAVKAQIYTATGATVGEEFFLNSLYPSVQDEPSLAALSNGGFVASWSTSSQVGDDTSGGAVKAQIYDASGNLVGDEILVNSEYEFTQEDSKVIGLPGGGFAIAWRSEDEQGSGEERHHIKLQIFNDDGTKLGSEFFANNVPDNKQGEPELIALNNGFMVIWQSTERLDPAIDKYVLGIRGQEYTATGQEVGNEFWLNTQLENTTKLPSITALENEGFAVIWENFYSDVNPIRTQMYKPADSLDYKAGETTDFNIKAALPDNQLTNVLSDVTISDVPTEISFNHGTNNNDGTWTISQSDLTGLKIIVATGYSGTPTLSLSVSSVVNGGSPTTTNLSVYLNYISDAPSLSFGKSYVTSSLEFPITDDVFGVVDHLNDVALLDNGNIVIAWRYSDSFGNTTPGDVDNQGYAILARIYDNSGAVISPEFLVNTEIALDQIHPSVTALNDGGFLITWSSESHGDNEYAIKGQRYDGAGTAQGGEFLVSPALQLSEHTPDITALTGGGFIISWRTTESAAEGNNVWAQIFDATADKVGTEFMVNHNLEAGSAKISALNDGGFVAVWGKGEFVKAQLFAANGAKVGDEFLINNHIEPGTVSVSKPSFDVTTLNNGNFAVIWTEAISSTDLNDVTAQIYRPDGTAVGSEFTVSQQDDVYEPHISALDDGGFVTTWSHRLNEPDQNLNQNNVYSQIFNASGEKIGDRFLSIPNEHNFDPSITDTHGLDDGAFLLTWYSKNAKTGPSTDTTKSIKGQVYTQQDNLDYEDGQTYGFDITVAPHPDHPTDPLSDITISNVPDELTFNNGTNNNDGTWTLTQANLTGLQITVANGYNGKVDLGVSINSTSNGETSTASISIPISVGNQITGSTGNDTHTATLAIDHVKLGDGIDSLTEAGAIADYSFAVIENKLQITHTASGDSNVDLLNSVETIIFDASSIDVADLQSLGHITDMTADEYSTWLSQNYNYDVA